MMKKAILLLSVLVFSLVRNQAQTVTDYDGNVYDTVTIGTQVWMKQNLHVTHYNNGIPIPTVTDFSIWSTLTTGARCYYNNDSATYDSIYGALYNWYSVVDENLICPTAWHVPTNTEWQEVEAYLGGAMIAGGKMKEAGTTHWKSPNTGATNSTGFTGLPGGARDPGIDYRTMTENGLWWTAKSYNGTMAWSVYMWYLFAGIDHNPTDKNFGASIRCIKDAETGLGEINKLEKVKLYPNPAKAVVTIENPYNQQLEIHIYNILADCVLHACFDGLVNEIDIRSLSKGTYEVIIICKEGTTRRTLIKQ
ncbi:MAG: T9SS type A sorting domain-containing protein [Bacteroidales bacterium]|nr:T9SS type A sorting domain-containing protein [Bacteroidales bacterium]